LRNAPTGELEKGNQGKEWRGQGLDDGCKNRRKKRTPVLKGGDKGGKQLTGKGNDEIPRRDPSY